jgi:hypothetical protein
MRKAMDEKQELRSHKWFGDRDVLGFTHRSWTKNQGHPDHMFDGRPVIGICNTWSDLTPCNAHFLTGRAAFKFATVPNHDEVVASIAERGRPVLVVNDFHSNPRWLMPVIAERPELFREIHRIGGHLIYQFEPAPGDGSAGP